MTMYIYKEETAAGVGSMNNAELRQFLIAKSARRDAMEWLGNRDSDQMWAECQRPDWLLWWAGKTVPRRDLVLAACDCVETALQFVPADEHRPRLAIETARRWANGEATLEEVANAADAAYAARAADAAAYAAYYAARAACAAYCAACAARVSRAAYAAAGADGANAAMLRLIRQRWPQCPIPVDKAVQQVAQ